MKSAAHGTTSTPPRKPPTTSTVSNAAAPSRPSPARTASAPTAAPLPNPVPRIVLSNNDIYLSNWARTKARCRRIIKVLALIAIPFVMAEAFAFGSFIYEEALQACGFASRMAVMSGDQALALDTTQNFEKCMKQAQWYQKHIGVLAFWTHGAYYTYFYRAAPAQLVGLYAEGKRLGMWEDDIRRFQMIDDPQRGPYFVDTWHQDPIAKLQALGFDPDLLNNARNCPACNQRERRLHEAEQLRDANGVCVHPETPPTIAQVALSSASDKEDLPTSKTRGKKR